MMPRARGGTLDYGTATARDMTPRETNGITSRLVLLYVDRVGGPGAIDDVLDRCGMRDRKQQLLDENYWFSYAEKIALFEAASELLDDAEVMLHTADSALDLNVAGGLKIALRALGSPRFVYQNIVRARMDTASLRAHAVRSPRRASPPIGG